MHHIRKVTLSQSIHLTAHMLTFVVSLQWRLFKDRWPLQIDIVYAIAAGRAPAWDD